MITKELLPSKDAYLQFTEDELLEFGIKQGDKFSVKLQDDGVFLEKYKEIELDIDDFDIITLKMLVLKSFQEDKTCNEVLIDVLQQYMDEQPIVKDEDPIFAKLPQDINDDTISTLNGINQEDHIISSGTICVDVANPDDEIKDQ